MKRQSTIIKDGRMVGLHVEELVLQERVGEPGVWFVFDQTHGRIIENELTKREAIDAMLNYTAEHPLTTFVVETVPAPKLTTTPREVRYPPLGRVPRPPLRARAGR
jgi:hypothetical protein